MITDLDTATDDQLWSVVNQTFAALNKMRTEHSDATTSETLDRYHTYVLARSQALMLLKQRGHEVEDYLASIGAYLRSNP